MAKRTPAAQIMNGPISDYEKLELVVTPMVRGPNTHEKMGFVIRFLDKFFAHATPEQRVALVKLHDVGWFINKIVWNNETQKIAFCVDLDGTAAWIAPDGKLQRSPIGKRIAYLDRNWKDL